MRKRLQDRALRRAAKLIRKGWATGAYRRGNCYCVMGAINAQTGYNPARVMGDRLGTNQLYKRLADHISGRPNVLGSHKCFEIIEEFNDHIARSAEEVAIKLVEASYA